mmetsp:Transcript_13052/g.30884  ORF Transcript_13052/g.30884 Transcript_13052/m.30884 type:complete len:204 (-) Transcript_13052:1179-1790(-)
MLIIGFQLLQQWLWPATNRCLGTSPSGHASRLGPNLGQWLRSSLSHWSTNSNTYTKSNAITKPLGSLIHQGSYETTHTKPNAQCGNYTLVKVSNEAANTKPHAATHSKCISCGATVHQEPYKATFTKPNSSPANSQSYATADALANYFNSTDLSTGWILWQRWQRKRRKRHYRLHWQEQLLRLLVPWKRRKGWQGKGRQRWVE